MLVKKKERKFVIKKDKERKLLKTSCEEKKKEKIRRLAFSKECIKLASMLRQKQAA